MLEKDEDRVGNNIFYTYSDFLGGETLLSRIDYTGFGTAAGDRTVNLTYNTRSGVASAATDSSSSYLAGGLTMQTKALTGITTKVGTATVRVLTPAYTVSSHSGRLVLNSLTECAVNGSISSCHPASNFIMFDSPVQTPFMSLADMSLPGIDTTTNEITSIGVVADFDGDGSRETAVRVHTATGDRDYLVQMTPDRVVHSAVDITGNSLTSPPGADFDSDGRAETILTPQTALDPQSIRLGIWNLPRGAVATGNPFTIIPTNIAFTYASFGDLQVADFDGDGRSDIAFAKPEAPLCGSDSGTPRKGVFVYKITNSPGAFGSSASFSAPVFLFCLGRNGFFEERIDHVSDFDGDGLPDFYIVSKGNSSASHPDYPVFRSIRLTRRNVSNVLSVDTKTCSQTGLPDSIGTESDACNWKRYAIQWTDVNGDGLEDLVLARLGSNWQVYLNQGGLFGPSIDTLSNDGLDEIVTTVSDEKAFRYAGRLPPIDVDSDGKSDLLVVSKVQGFAMKMCAFVSVPQNSGGECPEGFPAQPDAPEIDNTCPAYVCPEDPGGAINMPTNTGGFSGGFLKAWVDVENGNQYPVTGMYDGSQGNRGNADRSLYHLDMLKFEQTGPDTVIARVVSTPLISGLQSARAQDLFGDGLVDLVTNVGGSPVRGTTIGFGTHPSQLVVVANQSGNWGPSALPDGTPFCTTSGSTTTCPLQAHTRPYANVNVGAGLIGVSSTSPNQPYAVESLSGPVPLEVQSGNGFPLFPDLMQGVDTGMDDFVRWGYAPLGLPAAQGGMPLYTIPSSNGYADPDHYYFTSSMPVVFGMTKSNGVGGEFEANFRGYIYAYTEAMYNHKGRGFQGFRTVAAQGGPGSLRTTTKFHQKFPLTGKVEEVTVVEPTHPSAKIKWSVVDWRCSRSSRSTHCPGDSNPYVAATPGVIYSPYLDSQVDRSYDVPPPDGSSGLVTTSTTLNAANTSTQTSGWDDFGNLKNQVVTTADGGSGGIFVNSQTQTTNNTYIVNSSSWWLDQITSSSTTAAIAYNTSLHSLPAGVSAPSRSVTTNFDWNSNRTPQSKTVQPGITNQEAITTYHYPTTSYGLPDSLTVTASGASPSSRSTNFTYSKNGTSQAADGYFVLQTTNAAGHVTTTETRPRDGQVSRVIAPSNLSTITSFDNFGRPTQIDYRAVNNVALEPATYISLTRCTYSTGACTGGYGEGTGQAHSSFRTTVVKSGSPTQVTWADNLGRTVKQATRGFNGAFIQSLTEYNSTGTLKRQSAPYYSGSTAYWTTFDSYDVLDRVKQKTAPASQMDPVNGNVRTVYTYTGAQTKIRVQGTNVTTGTCPINKPCMEMYRYYDSLGHLVKTQDALNGITRFWYDGAGNPVGVQSPQGAAQSFVTKASYNAIGQRLNRTDPDAGYASFTYDALGQVLTETDARSITTAMTYDAIGRMVLRNSTNPAINPGLPNENVLDTWSYDASVPGMLDSQKRQRGSGGSMPQVWLESYAYNSNTRRLSSQTTTMEAELMPWTTSYGYDTLGRESTVTYPSGLAITKGYTDFGYLNALSNGSSSFNYWSATNQDAWGNITGETYSGVNTGTHQTYASTGQWQQKRWTRTSNNTEAERVDYQYDSFGNLTRQGRFNANNVYEQYSYDRLQRLTHVDRATAVGPETTDYSYSADGNLTSKSDYSPDAFLYGGNGCPGRPHFVTDISTFGYSQGSTGTYACDANGNVASRVVFTPNGGNATGKSGGKAAGPPTPVLTSTMALAYDFQNLTLNINHDNSNISDFRYGADGNRFLEQSLDAGVSTITHFGPRGYEKSEVGGSVTFRHELGPITIRKTDSGSFVPVSQMRDRLGSPLGQGSATGSITSKRAFDSFGEAKNGDFSESVTHRLGLAPTTLRGFTGHEHLDNLGLIHMNGRIYDPKLGRFFSVDPVIQFPSNSQSLNPYSYILNNPLAGRDPSGYASECVVTENNSCTAMNNDPRSADKMGHTTFAMNSDKNVMAYGSRGGSAMAINNSGRNGAVGMSSQGAGGGANAHSGAADQMGISNSPESKAGAPSQVISQCKGYSLPSSCDGKSNDKETQHSAETHIAGGDKQINPDWRNPDVTAYTSMNMGVVTSNIPFNGNIPNSFMENASKEWSGNAGQIKVNFLRQPTDDAQLNVMYVSTPVMAGLVCNASCIGTFMRGNVGYTNKSGTIFIDENQPRWAQQKILSHELGHYFFGLGHPKAEGDFLFRGVMDYKGLRVRDYDRAHYYSIYSH